MNTFWMQRGLSKAIEKSYLKKALLSNHWGLHRKIRFKLQKADL